MVAPAGGGAAPAAPVVAAPVVAALTNIQVTDAAGTLVLGPDANNVALGGATITTAAGAVTIMVTADQTNEHNGGPVVGNQYNIQSTQGNFANVQLLNNTPYLHRFQ